MRQYKRFNITWKIAIRKRQKFFLDSETEFIVLNNPRNGWLADPFIVEHEGHTYIFAERWDYRQQKGVISYGIYEGNADVDWKDIIEEQWHLSYPFVWADNLGFHILPEAADSNQLYYYTAIVFPDVWKRDKRICSGRFADSTLHFTKSKNYIYSYSMNGLKGRLYRSEIDFRYPNNVEWEFITKDPRIARPGGGVIEDNGQFYRMAQDCSNSYGEKIVAIKLVEDSEGYREEIEKVIDYRDIRIPKKKRLIGIHTYNRTDKYEVIDLRYFGFNYRDYFSERYHGLKKWIKNIQKN